LSRVEKTNDRKQRRDAGTHGRNHKQDEFCWALPN
jgi:hypothetical protein